MTNKPTTHPHNQTHHTTTHTMAPNQAKQATKHSNTSKPIDKNGVNSLSYPDEANMKVW
jgi:hypothetical protein